MGIKVGIDLGTTFSAVAVMDETKGQPVIIPNTNGEKITPSVVQFTENGDIIVGTEAKEAFEAGEPGCVSTFKRRMGDSGAFCSFNGKSYTAEDLSAILLKHLKEEAESVTGEKIDEAVITVPAYFYHKERQSTINAGKRAGLNVRQIINEPTAAAMNYGVNHWRENARVLVYDLGGGTFDVTLVEMKADNRMESLQTLGDHTLGGKDWDLRIADIIQDRIEAETGLTLDEYPEISKIVFQTAENVKKQLTSRISANVRVTLPSYGNYTTTVTLDEFESCTTDLLAKTGSLCEGLLSKIGIGWNDITDILLVGGSTRMKQVSTYLKRISGHTPLSQVNPDEAVALGAAIQVHLPSPKYNVVSVGGSAQEKIGHVSAVGSEKRLGNALSIRSEDVVAHAMGIIAVNTEGTEYINKTIIPANQKIPAKCAESFHFYTQSNDDNEVEIYMLQGDKSPLNCQITGKYVASGIQHSSSDNPTTIRIQYSYDINGIVHVQARQGDSDRDLPVREEPVPADMSKFGLPIPQKEKYSRPEDLSVVMAVDVSGSMSGEPLDDALRAMRNFVDQFGSYGGNVSIGLIAVSDKSFIVQNLTSSLTTCRSSISSIKACMTGICNSGHPFNDIKSMLWNRNGRKVAIVLADGIWNNQEDAIAAARKCHSEGIEVVGVGFGSADKTFLSKISNGSIGSMFVQQSQLSASFGKIAQEIGSGSSSKKGRTDNASGTSSTWLAVNEE